MPLQSSSINSLMLSKLITSIQYRTKKNIKSLCIASILSQGVGGETKAVWAQTRVGMCAWEWEWSQWELKWGRGVLFGRGTGTFPDGAWVESEPDDAWVESEPDGEWVESEPDDAWVESDPDGEWVESEPDYAWVESEPDGACVVSEPDGTWVESQPDGKSLNCVEIIFIPTRRSEVQETVISAEGIAYETELKKPQGTAIPYFQQCLIKHDV